MTDALSKLNFRDVGGLPTVDGRRLRPGVLYRCEGPANFDDAHCRELAGLGIRLVCDMRAEQERDAAPNRWHGSARLYHLDINNVLREASSIGWEALRDDPSPVAAQAALANSYAAMPGAILPHVGGFIDAMIAGEVPALIHCTAGKDRTGVLVALLLTLAGVPHDAIVADYHRSDIFGQNMKLKGSVEISFFKAFGYTPAAEIIDAMIGVDTAFLEAAFASVRAGWGSVPAWFAAGGVDAAKTAAFRDRLIAADIIGDPSRQGANA